MSEGLCRGGGEREGGQVTRPLGGFATAAPPRRRSLSLCSLFWHVLPPVRSLAFRLANPAAAIRADWQPGGQEGGGGRAGGWRGEWLGEWAGGTTGWLATGIAPCR